jgi:manganese/iron transport system permease protein/iron/zinc/copper transport system permease protein
VSALLEPFHFEFFRNGMAVATIAGALCGLVGVYVVLRGMSYIGHGLSHAIFGGAVASFLAGVNFYVGAGAWGLVSALLINGMSRRRTIGADAAIGVVTTASFAAGVAMISRRRTFTRNFEAALFGDVLGVTEADLLAVTIVALLAAAVVFLRYRTLLFSTFDPEVADITGIATRRVDALLSLVLAGVIVATMPVLGVTLIAAALVIPPVIARLLTERFGRMMALSIVLGAVSGLVGLYLSFYLDINSGSAVVLVAAAMFLVVYAATARRRPARLVARPE